MKKIKKRLYFRTLRHSSFLLPPGVECFTKKDAFWDTLMYNVHCTGWQNFHQHEYEDHSEKQLTIIIYKKKILCTLIIVVFFVLIFHDHVYLATLYISNHLSIYLPSLQWFPVSLVY